MKNFLFVVSFSLLTLDVSAQAKTLEEHLSIMKEQWCKPEYFFNLDTNIKPLYFCHGLEEDSSLGKYVEAQCLFVDESGDQYVLRNGGNFLAREPHDGFSEAPFFKTRQNYLSGNSMVYENENSVLLRDENWGRSRDVLLIDKRSLKGKFRVSLEGGGMLDVTCERL